jgi:hypothetical protein
MLLEQSTCYLLYFQEGTACDIVPDILAREILMQLWPLAALITLNIVAHL